MKYANNHPNKIPDWPINDLTTESFERGTGKNAGGKGGALSKLLRFFMLWVGLDCRTDGGLSMH